VRCIWQTVGDDDDRRSLTDKNVEDEEDLSEAVATDTEKDSGTKGKPKVAESPDAKVPLPLRTTAHAQTPPHTHTRHSLTWRDTRGTRQDKKKKGSKKEKTSKKSSSPSRGVTFEGSQQASSADKAKEAKEKTDSKVRDLSCRVCRAVCVVCAVCVVR
jgi:hypothetical protein